VTERNPHDEETNIRNESVILTHSMSDDVISKKELFNQTVIVTKARPRVVPLPIIGRHRSSALSASYDNRHHQAP
jgi:translation initiation factor 2B subunit (eIF-2B alpha/beta/delta family)